MDINSPCITGNGLFIIGRIIGISLKYSVQERNDPRYLNVWWKSPVRNSLYFLRGKIDDKLKEYPN